MSRVYLPSITNSNCIVILDKDTIRVYNDLPTAYNLHSYTDYFINSHYLSKTGEEYIETVPVCEDHVGFTTEVYYRNDLSDILIIFLIIVLIGFYLPYKILARLFGRWLKI